MKLSDVNSLAARVDDAFERWEHPAPMGCAVQILRGGELLCCRCYGAANLGHDVPVTPDTVFHIASVSKQFTVTAALVLEREGRLSLDDDVRRWLPELPDYGRTIRLRHLVHHISGLRDQWELLMLAGWRMEDVITTADIMRLVTAQRGLNFEPGARYLYCNTGYTLLARAIERATGEPFHEFCGERIFRPLGMGRTQFCPDHAAIIPGRASSYRTMVGGGIEHAFLAFATTGATSILTTIRDLSKWEGNFHRPLVGDAELLAGLLRRGVLNDGQTIDYAGGLMYSVYWDQPTYQHGGSDAGYRAHFMRLPRLGAAVIILANVLTKRLPQLACAIADACFDDELGVPAPPKTAVAAPAVPCSCPEPAELPRYAGVFYSRELDVIYRVEVEADGLVLDRCKYGRSPLLPLGQGRFQGDMAPNTVDSLPMQLSFDLAGTGPAASFSLSSSRAWNLQFARVEL